MKMLLSIFIILSVSGLSFSQNLVVEGEVKITEMTKNNAADSVVVRLPDGTLGIRDASSLSGISYLGKDTLGGIIFYIYKGSDGKDHGLIVAKNEITAQWQNLSSLTNASRSWDGMYNMGQMTNSPAKIYIQSLGAEWYLPSIDELGLLWQNRFHANQALFVGGFTLLATDDIYWSSTEINAAFSFGFDFSEVRSDPGGKTEIHSVRAIRAF